MNRSSWAFATLVIGTALVLPAYTYARPKADKTTVSKAVNKRILDTVTKELRRSMRSLRVKDSPPPYFIGYKITEVEVNDAVASLGAIIGRKERHFVSLEAHVHVGSYKLDNSNFSVASRERVDGIVSVQLPLEATPRIARRAAWLATDAAYKEALEQLTAKLEARKTGTGAKAPSYSKAPPVKANKAVLVPKLAKAKELDARAKRLSRAFRGIKHLREARVAFTSFLERRWYINTEGTRAHDTRRVSGVIIVASTQAASKDGQELALYYSRYGLTEKDLPSDQQLLAEAKKLSAQLEKLRNAPLMGNYTGPVLFEGTGAAQIVRHTLAPHLGGTPVPGGLNRVQAKRFGGAFADRIGQRILATNISLTDDPTRTKYGKRRLIGSFKLDDEGTRAQRVAVVQKGFLKTLLTSRTPSKHIQKSNGHARRQAPGGGFHGSATNLIMTSTRGVSRAQLKRKLLAKVKKEGLKFGVIIRRFDDSALTAAPELARLQLIQLLRTSDPDAPPPTSLAYKVYPNGREELVRGAELKPVDMGQWKRIMATGRRSTLYNFLASVERHIEHKITGVDQGFVPSAGVESAIVAPDLLFEELGITRTKVGFREKPAVPRPTP